MTNNIKNSLEDVVEEILVEIFTYESRSMYSHSLTMDNGLSNRLTYFRY